MVPGIKERKIINGLLEKIYKESCKMGISAYIVGGYIRDLFAVSNLKFSNRVFDIDFVLDKDVKKIAKKIASEFNGNYVNLNKKFNTTRVIVKEKDDVTIQFDFTLFKGDTIEQDLVKRDFTVNSIAVKLEDFLETKETKNLYKKAIFPDDTLSHFKNRQIVSVSSNFIIDDPLRMLRAFSIGACLGFRISDKVLLNIKKNIKLINNVSIERIRDEIFRLLSATDSYEYILKMVDIGLFDEIFPELKICRDVYQGPYHRLGVYYHSIECIKTFEINLDSLYKDNYLAERLNKFLKKNVAGERSMKSLIKLSLLYHDAGKPEAKHTDNDKIKFWGHEKISRTIIEKMSNRLRLANSESRVLKDLVYYHMRPGHLVQQEQSTKRARYKFFRDAGENTPAVILVSIADKYATGGELVSEESMKKHKDFLIELLKEYFHIKEKIEPKKLIDGNDIMDILNIKSCPLVGKILGEIKLLQMQGKLKNRNQAVKIVEDYRI